jgi:hypothetical protein
MNQFFSFKRFKLLVLKHWIDHKKRYILSVLAYFGLVTLWYLCGILISANKRLPEEIQLTTFYFSLFTIGTFYASQYYSDLGSKAKGSHFLLVPASSFEKFLCSLLYTVVLFSLFLAAAFYVAEIIMVNGVNAFSGADPGIRKSEVVNVFKQELIRFDPQLAINLFLFFLSVQSIFLFGSVYFRKYNFIKTIITCFVIFLLCFLAVYLIHLLFPHWGEDDFLDSSETWLPPVLRVLAYAVAPILWAFTYYKLKAKHV